LSSQSPAQVVTPSPSASGQLPPELELLELLVVPLLVELLPLLVLPLLELELLACPELDELDELPVPPLPPTLSEKANGCPHPQASPVAQTATQPHAGRRRMPIEDLTKQKDASSIVSWM
jgi:hypothetical protein